MIEIFNIGIVICFFLLKNQINMETWGNTAQSVLNDCLVGPGEVNEAAIDAECFKNAIHALRRLYKK